MRDMTPIELFVAEIGLGIMLGAFAERLIGIDFGIVGLMGAVLLIMASTGVLRRLGRCLHAG